MKIQVSEATPVQINYLVGACEGLHWEEGDIFAGVYGPGFAPATDWTDAGPIIEREEIGTKRRMPCMRGEEWEASGSPGAKGAGYSHAYGPTPLIAAMRCYVASRLGAEVDVPDELI